MIAMKQDFVVGGKQVHLTSDKVLSALRGIALGPIHIHAVEINGRTYPVKKALSIVTGLDLLDFNTNQARNIFRGLGFKVVRVD